MSRSVKNRAAPVARSTANKPDVAVPSTAMDRDVQEAAQYDAEVEDLNARILDAVNAVVKDRRSHWLAKTPWSDDPRDRLFAACEAENAIREMLAVAVEAAVAKVAGFESWPAFERHRASQRLDDASYY